MCVNRHDLHAGVALLANAPRHPPEKSKKKRDEVSERVDVDVSV